MAKIRGSYSILTEDEWNKRLLESINPFSGIIARSAWDESPDVETINGKLTKQVIDLLHEVKEQKYTKLMLVQGQPGIGKTHFISRLRRISVEENFLFVAVKPISSVTTIFSHIYREIFVSLRKRVKDEKYNSMEKLISYIISTSLVKALREKKRSAQLNQRLHDLIEKLEREPTLILNLIEHDLNTMRKLRPLSEIAIKNVEREFPEVDIMLLKVLFKTLDLKLHQDAMRWLQGDDIDDDILNLLGVKESISDENVAQRVLHSIMTLSNQPLLLCFDQLESIHDRFHDPNVLKTFFDTLVRLCNETPNALVLLMVQAVVWADQMYPLVQISAKDRIEHMHSLHVPNDKEMKELVIKRLNQIWGIYPYPPHINTYPFSENYIKALSESQGWNPRSVLKQLSIELQYMKSINKINLLDTFTIETKARETSKEYNIAEFIDNQLKRIITQYKETIDNNSYITRENYLEAGFLDILKGLQITKIPFNDKIIEKVTFKQKTNEIDLIATFKLKDDSINNLGIEICNNERGVSFNNVLKMIQRNLNQNNFEKWVIIRDINLPVKKTWKKSVELLNTLSSSGSLYPIDIEDDATIYACKELLDLSSAGDLDIDGRIVTRKEVIPHLLNKILPNIDILNTIFGGKSNHQDDLITIKTTKKDKLDDIKEKILTQANSNMMVCVNKFFSDFNKKADFYKKVIDGLVSESKLIILVEKKNHIVVAKPASEDVF